MQGNFHICQQDAPSALECLNKVCCHRSAAFCHAVPSALCPLPSALCPLPSALCPLPSVMQCPQYPLSRLVLINNVDTCWVIACRMQASRVSTSI